MRRISIASITIAVFMPAGAARAQVAAPASSVAPVTVAAAAATARPPMWAARTRLDLRPFEAWRYDFPPARERRPPVLLPLYAGMVALEAYDTYSTLQALHKGAVEANPLMGGIANRPAVFVAVKGATTVANIYVAERLWRKDKKAAAIAMMVVNNGVLAVVAARNRSVLRKLH